MYGTVAGYKAYHLARNNDIPVSDDPDIEAALLVASEWIDGSYITQFGGLKTGGRDQVREWPRTGVNDVYGYYIPADTVPREIENATYEAAWRQIVKPGSLSIDYTPGKYESVSVDGAVSVKYAGFSYASDVQTQFDIIDKILFPILTAYGVGGGFSSLCGSVSRV